MLIFNVLINVLILSVNIDVNIIILIYRYNKHEYNLFTLYDFIYEIMYILLLPFSVYCHYIDFITPCH